MGRNVPLVVPRRSAANPGRIHGRRGALAKIDRRRSRIRAQSPRTNAIVAASRLCRAAAARCCRRLAGDGGLEGAALLQPARPAHSARRARQAARLLRQPLAARLAIAHRPTAVARAGHGQLQAGWRPCAREKPRAAHPPVIWRVFGTSPCRARGGMVADCGERAGRARRASERVTDK